jgi:hypothetical protein
MVNEQANRRYGPQGKIGVCNGTGEYVDNIRSYGPALTLSSWQRSTQSGSLSSCQA